jgi:hypothetical protein
VKSKEIAKFLSGLAGNQVMTHAALAVGGIRFTLFGIPYTPTLNAVATVVWAVLLALLVYYAWMKKQPRQE